MTCIVAWKGSDGVIMGGDSLATYDSFIQERDDPKVFHVGEFLIGCAGSFRTAQVLRYRLKPPKQPKNMSDHQYLCTTFIDHVRGILEKAGRKHVKEELEQVGGGVFLIGYRGNIYKVDWDFNVGIPNANFIAIGSGREVAMGAMYALQATYIGAPSRMVELAILAAEEYIGSVGGHTVQRRQRKE